MGEHADDLINGDVDYITGEWLGNGQGFPITTSLPRKLEDLSWKRVTGYMNTMGIKNHLHPQTLKDYGCNYSGRHPLRNACFEVIKDFEKFKVWIQTFKSE